MSLVLRRTALFVFIVLIWALVAAAVAHASVREIMPAAERMPTPVAVLR
jgi:methionine-rich copper-binding protein CopC